MKMKKFYTMLLLAAATCGTASAQYQLPNSGFEEWETVTYNGKTGEEPVKWSSFLDGSEGILGSSKLKSTAGVSQMEKSSDVKHGGNYCAKIWNREINAVIVKAQAQGNITTGCINMGSITATDATGNFNYVGYSDNTREDQNAKFKGRPDAIKFWVKFKGSKDYGNASVYLLTDGYYQDPDAGSNTKQNNTIQGRLTAKKVAHAKNGTIKSLDSWQEVTIPFTYYDDAAVPTQVLASFSTCATAGGGAKGDEMYLDDIVMVYNSELETAKYNDAAVTFTDGKAIVDAEYEENLLSLTSNGRAATIEKSFNAATGVLTITVKGDNISEDASNFHTYTIKFKATATMSVSAAAGWGTFCAPFNVDVPAGAVAYTVTKVSENGVLTTNRLPPTTLGSRIVTIPANTPVVLSATKDINANFKGTAVEDTPVNGYLTGVYVDTPAPVGSYVLQNQSDGVGFYLVEDVQPTIKANRCYLTLPAGSSARALFFDESDFVTALDNAIIVDEPEAAYDLQGRRVYPEHQSKGVNVAGQKGMLIIGGRKVIK